MTSALASALLSISESYKKKADFFERSMMCAPHGARSHGSTWQFLSSSVICHGSHSCHASTQCYESLHPSQLHDSGFTIRMNFNMLNESVAVLNEVEGISGKAYTKIIEKFENEVWRALFLRYLRMEERIGC
ncbi:LOW QUALITY PROTEIN: hypothetical protein PanWU01x14_344610 [Parasponia andersonii]|uniref:Uncharacterized protein n=1 Tax=Parasponia andersonii TaxID=3476 RepID=A0A2P5AD10_PARAD|nr:LOW QUALITY PROTEIN: hypothetical protein PanWU01x14_344610 [Parasponia andersonii]